MASRNFYRRGVVFPATKSGAAKAAAYALRVHNDMLANVATFTAPPVALATFQTAIDDVALAVANYGASVRNRGSKANLVLLQAALATMIGILKQEIDYVNNVARGIGEVAVLGGVALDRQRDPRGVLGSIQELRQQIKPANSGGIVIKWKRPLGSTKINVSYQVQLATAPTAEDVEATVTLTRTKATIADFGVATPSSAFMRVRALAPVLNASSTSDSFAVGAWSPFIKVAQQF